MQINALKPRYWVAIGLGVFSATVLSALILDGDLVAKFNKPPEPQVIITTGTVKSGDILARILKRHEIPDLTAYNIQKKLGSIFSLRRMRPKDRYEVVTSTFGLFKKFIYHPDPIHSYQVTRSSMGVYSSKEIERSTIWKEKYVSGKISEGLYKDLTNQGYSENFVANLVGELGDNIFAWRIDFFTEQRKGDKFEVLLLQEYLQGKDVPLKGRRLKVIAAKYFGRATNSKKNVAIRYRHPGTKRSDYYDEKGKAVRKAFLRAPFTHSLYRISSGFNPKRYHPILRKYRPHHGTDFAAPRGTRIAAIGKGKVIFAGRKGAYGKCIEIKHDSKHVSRYGHLSVIAVKKGRSVEQGQYIGKVGSTGLSTGPHLHFEMLVNGVQKNFRRMRFPPASSVSAKNITEFKRVRDRHLNRLNALKEIASSKTTNVASTN